VKPKFFIARAAAPMLFGSRGRTRTILQFISAMGGYEKSKGRLGGAGL
jgi:hypothetical protein